MGVENEIDASAHSEAFDGKEPPANGPPEVKVNGSSDDNEFAIRQVPVQLENGDEIRKSDEVTDRSHEEVISVDGKKRKSASEIDQRIASETPLIETEKATKVEVVMAKDKEKDKERAKIVENGSNESVKEENALLLSDQQKVQVDEPTLEQVKIEDNDVKDVKDKKSEIKRKGFWSRFWSSSKQAQIEPITENEKEKESETTEETATETSKVDEEKADAVPANDVGSDKNSQEETTTATDVTIPICEKKDVDDVDKLTPTHRMFRVRSPWAKYWMIFAIFLGVLAFISSVLIFKYPNALATLTMATAQRSQNTVLIQTPCGRFRGRIEENIAVFRGVPFALPPVGQYRWSPPRATKCSNNSLIDASLLKPFCFQKPVSGFNVSYSEDCLYLNIWSPELEEEREEKLPVVVYIPGESFTGLNPVDVSWTPSGTRFVKKYRSLFVSIAYRTGAFGFLAINSLSRRNGKVISGNYGFLDQMAALKWIHENIEHFGGDQNRIYLLGQGAGADSALVLAANEETKQLISGIWISSPSSEVSSSVPEDVYKYSSEFISNVGCNNTLLVDECLLNKSSDEILNGTPLKWYDRNQNQLPEINEQQSPKLAVIDQNVIKSDPWKRAFQGSIKIVIGSAVHDNGYYYWQEPLQIAKLEQTAFVDKLRAKLSTIDAKFANASITYYLNSKNDTFEQIYFRMISDIRANCPLERTITEVMKETVPRQNIHWYLINYLPSVPIRLTKDISPPQSPLAIHGVDILAIFDQLTNWYIANPTMNDFNYVKTMQTAFHGFVHDLAVFPNGLVDGHLNEVTRNGTVEAKPMPYPSCSQVWNQFMHLIARFAKHY